MMTKSEARKARKAGAAAPELLAALRAAENALAATTGYDTDDVCKECGALLASDLPAAAGKHEMDCETDGVFKTIRAAIAKAEGREG